MNWSINFKYIQHTNIEFEFEDILNLSSVYSRVIHWIYKPMAALSREITIYGRSVIAGVRVGEA